MTTRYDPRRLSARRHESLEQRQERTAAAHAICGYQMSAFRTRPTGSCGHAVGVPEPHELVNVSLTDDERYVLNRGLVEWGGPARCTDAMAVAMGFESVRDLFAESDRILDVLDAKGPLSASDWTRTLLATEVVFASDVMGSGAEWPITTGLSDADTLRLLRQVQRKLVAVRVPLGPRPDL